MLDAKNANAYYNRALLNYNLGKNDLAFDDLHAALRLKPGQVEYQELLKRVRPDP